MKPLELTVFATHTMPDGPGIITTVYESTPYGDVYDWKVDRDFIPRKRLTDTELAAEYWRAHSDQEIALQDSTVYSGWFTGCLVRSVAWDDECDEGASEVDYDLTVQWLDVIQRFATAPDYNQETL